MSSKKKKEKDKETLPSDGITYAMDDWVPSDGLLNAGTGTVDSLDPGLDVDFNVSYGDLELQTADMFEAELRKKYPALQDAYDHYLAVKQMCETREKEEDDA